MGQSIVLVGGGFAGVECARRLERHLPHDWELILLSQENHIVFTPLLAEVVGASISPLHVVWPIRQRLRRTICRTATVTRIDLAARTVEYQTAGGSVAVQPFDHLVLACGSMVNMAMMPGLAAHAFPLKTLGDAFALRNHLIQQLEQAEVETDAARRRDMLSVAVIGGGFSGVEVAGEIFDLLSGSRKFYPALRGTEYRVTVLHGPKRLLPEMPEALAEFARVRMQRRGIDIRLGQRAQAVSEVGVHLADGSVVRAGTIVCTIGNIANPLVANSELPLDRGRIRTEPDMRVAGQEGIWALGDCAQVTNEYDGAPSPPVAQFAVRQARQLAANLLRVIAGRPTRPFSFRMLGSFAAIGHRRAVGRVLGLHFSGFPAWFLWRGIYLAKMPTVARKIQIAFDWAWQLFFPRDIVQLSRRETERLPREHFEPGEYVFRKGARGEKFYLIERGRAGVYLDEAGDPVTVLGPGQFFGERAIMRSETRWASLRAEEPLDVLSIRRGPFQDMLGHLAILRTGMEKHLDRIESAWNFTQSLTKHSALTETLVQERMSRRVPALPATATFGDLLRHFERPDHDCAVLLDNRGRAQRIFSRSDACQAAFRSTPRSTELAELAGREPVHIAPDRALSEAMLLFIRQGIDHLIVAAADELPSGILTPFDVFAQIQRERSEDV